MNLPHQAVVAGGIVSSILADILHSSLDMNYDPTIGISEFGHSP